MSSASGVQATDELLNELNSFLSSDKRTLFMVIDNEACHPGKALNGSSDFVKDLDLVRQELKHNEAAYFIHRLDNDKFMFAVFVPDHAHVRSKMLYASSANGLHKQLGGSERFGEVVFWTELDELSESGWKEHEAHVSAVDPANDEERALQTALDREADQMLGTSGRRSHLDTRSTGVSKPATSSTVQMQFNDSVIDAVEQLKQTTDVALGLHIDLTNERVYVGKDMQQVTTPLTIIDKVTPQYTIHKANESIVFIYTCPSQSKVKERMIYASNRQGVLNQLKNLGLEISRILEASDGDDLTEDDLFNSSSKETSSATSDQQGSTGSSARPKFNRPKRPGR